MVLYSPGRDASCGPLAFLIDVHDMLAQCYYPRQVAVAYTPSKNFPAPNQPDVDNQNEFLCTIMHQDDPLSACPQNGRNSHAPREHYDTCPSP